MAQDKFKSPDLPKEKLRLLIVDDDVNDLELCLSGLKKSGLLFEAFTASARDEFARKLREPQIDVVLSDYNMKEWTGMDALAMVKAVRPDVPVILLTGSLGDETAVECIKLGITDYVLKDRLARLPAALARAREEQSLREAESRAIEALRQSESRYRGLVENSMYGIFWTDVASGRFLDVNPALATILGYGSTDELMRVDFVKSLYCQPREHDEVVSVFRSSGRTSATVDWKKKDGKVITVHMIGRKTMSPDGKSECAEVMVEDITERKILEKQLVQAQKFEAIGQLAGGVAHDFNNMIGAILGWADLGIEETELGSRLHRHFEKVRQQGLRAAALTKQLLAFARRQILEPRNVDLNKTVVETLSLLEKVIGSNIEIRADLPPDVALVRADPTQIEQVLMNLCINARDAMPAGGSLVIETRNMFLDERFCAAQPLAHVGDYVLLSVTDTGTGMDAATLDRIFEPFFTTKELGKGTGLGLATVYGIVRQHGGFLQVHSEPGSGTTFSGYFPVSTEAVAAPERTEEVGPVQGGSETILLAEDHEGLRQLAVETLTTLGYTVVLAADGEQAVQEFHLFRDQVRLALLDVMLPKMSGLEVYERIRRFNPELPAIFVTGYSADVALIQKVRQEGWPVLQKPYASRVLARTVRETLDQRARVPSATQND